MDDGPMTPRAALEALGFRRRGWSIERALTVPVGAPETRLRPNNGGGQRCKKA